MSPQHAAAYGHTDLVSSAPRPRILVIDDEPIVRDVVCRYLERESFRTLEARDGEEAFRMLRAEDVQLVATIDRLVHQHGYTLRGARLAIEQGGGKSAPEPRESLAAAPVQVSPDITPRLREIRNALAEALAAG